MSIIIIILTVFYIYFCIHTLYFECKKIKELVEIKELLIEITDIIYSEEED